MILSTHSLILGGANALLLSLQFLAVIGSELIISKTNFLKMSTLKTKLRNTVPQERRFRRFVIFPY